MREVVLGHDTRVAITSPAPDWADPERRATFLLVDVPRPLSVDEAVWLRKDSSLVVGRGVTIETPKFARLDEAIAAAGPDETVIALTTWAGPGEPELGFAAAEPAEVQPGWERLGWDVAEATFPSALTNCGYGADRRTFVSRFGERLNAHHLFDDVSVAFAFRDAQWKRIPEHGPWSVVGLYRVR